LHAKGLVEQATPILASVETIPPVVAFCANNCGIYAERGFTTLGWNPKAKPVTNDEMINAEVEVVLPTFEHVIISYDK